MNLESVGGKEDGQGNGSKGETKAGCEIGGRIVSGGHCHLQENVVHEM